MDIIHHGSSDDLMTTQTPPKRSHQHSKRSYWDLFIVILGVNLWLCFAILPVLTLESIHLTRPLLATLGLPLALLLFGLFLRHRFMLLGAFPVSLLTPCVIAPQMLGVNVYTSWIFALVAMSFLAYLSITAYVLQLSPTLLEILDETDLGPSPRQAQWRHAQRIYRWMTGFTIFFPLLFIYFLYLDPKVSEQFRQSFPDGALEAKTLFGVLMSIFWLGTFRVYFSGTMWSHVRGDPHLKQELADLRAKMRRRRVTWSFYLYVGLALLLLGAMVLVYASSAS